MAAAAAAAVPVVWQFLRDYQKNRIYTFLDPESDPLGAGYHILQSKIALGSGGLFGKGFLLGTQSHLSFLPEKQTDFIFTTLAEEFGFVGGLGTAGALYAGHRLWLCDRLAQPQPFRPAARARHRDQFLALRVHQHGDGDGPHSGGRRAAAADLLWRHRDAHGDVRLRPADERRRPSRRAPQPERRTRSGADRLASRKRRCSTTCKTERRLQPSRSAPSNMRLDAHLHAPVEHRLDYRAEAREEDEWRKRIRRRADAACM